MLILTADDVRQALPMRDAIEAMKSAYASLSDGRAVAPLRTRLPVRPHEGLVLFMPAFVQTGTSEALAVKIVSLFPQNPQHGLAYIQAAVLVLEADTGRARTSIAAPLPAPVRMAVSELPSSRASARPVSASSTSTAAWM